ncbi:serpin family protein [Mucilaginibacter sp.]|uniref:serpin family protein n=1 Tax=Mucilaginibacter sp. TaxID=1882438 RepID=UPI003D12F54A
MEKHKTPLLILSFLLTAFASCNKSSVVPDKGKSLVLTAEEQQKVTADNVFSLKLFRKLDSANTAGVNLFASPLSVSFAIGMTSNGSSGATLDAIRNAMDFTAFTQAQVNSYYNKIITQLPQLDPANTTLSIANSIWYRQDFSVLPQFLQTNTSYYNAKVQALDFNSPASVNTINNWVSSATKGKIPTIVDQLVPNDMMYLINAIYFKSSWNMKFNIANTRLDSFYLGDNSTVQASFMNGTVNFNYSTDGTVAVFELPYVNSRFSMVIVMPIKSTTSLNTVISGLTPDKWAALTASMEQFNGQFKMPKFKFGYSILLNNALSDLGMGNAFSDNADFSLINATAHLQISKVQHKAVVEVNEDGTTAAAVTSVSIIATATAQPNAVIDHPFIFAIREKSSGLILFTGRVNNPLLAGD